MEQIIIDVWTSLKSFLKDKQDLPNWLCLIISVIFIPSIIHWWKTRAVSNISRLDINILPGTMNIGSNPFDCIYIKITNHSDSRIFLSNARILNPTKNFIIASAADKDVHTGSYILRFPDSNHQFQFLEISLDTNGGSSETCLPLAKIPNNISDFRSSKIRRLFGLQKYFDLHFDVIVGSKRKIVKMQF